MDDFIYPCYAYFMTDDVSANLTSDPTEQNPDRLADTLGNLTTIMNGACSIVIIVVGFLLNMLTIGIFLTEKSELFVYTHLVYLGVWDSVLLVPSALFMYCLPTLLTGWLTLYEFILRILSKCSIFCDVICP